MSSVGSDILPTPPHFIRKKYPHLGPLGSHPFAPLSNRTDYCWLEVVPDLTMAVSRFLLLFLLSLPFFASASCSSDADALLAMKSQWQASLSTWITGTDPCTDIWEGVTCNVQLRVTALNLTNEGLIGRIPNEISDLDLLTSLDLSNVKGSPKPWNKITGDLSAIRSLTNLQVLNLSLNEFNMEFPSAVLQLTNLIALRLDHANITGTIPTGLAQLTKLQYLYLGNNSITGTLPIELGNMVELVELSLWKNSLTSSIPKELANLISLEYLNLHDCSLWGGLPQEFRNLTSMKILNLSFNKLTGIIPDTWKNMENLQELHLQSNYLTKYFPLWTLSHSSLNILDLSLNLLYGPFPNLNNTHLKTVNLACNYFNGSSPVKPLGMILHDVGNCFSGESRIKNSNCPQYYQCSEFFKKVPDGTCPPCPQFQNQIDAMCTCGEEEQTAPDHSKSSHAGIIIGSISAVTFFLLVLLVACLKWRNPKNGAVSIFGRNFFVKELHEYWEAPKEIQRFTFEELAKATSNFARNHEIGAGSFGKVFCGTLDSGKMVAVKCASASSLQGSHEFRNEVLLLSRLHHRNLVRLEGFCEDDGIQILVYEYMTNGNLHNWLLRDNTSQIVDWYKRLEIAVSVAQGLDYLHSFADPPVIHRDVKPSNILLDNHLVAKLADFGISRTTQEFETHISTTPAGTAGYIDPEYFLRRQLTTASDVYGFGVVLLELITGQKAIDDLRLDEQNLVEWVKLKLKFGGFESIVDPRLGSEYPAQIYFDITQLATDCAAFNRNERPSMKEVVTVLETHLSAVCPYDIIWQPQNSIQKELAEMHLTAKSSDAAGRDSTCQSAVAATRAAFRGSIVLPR